MNKWYPCCCLQQLSCSLQHEVAACIFVYGNSLLLIYWCRK